MHIKTVKENRKDSDMLFDYICEIYNIKQPTGLMFKQMKDFRGEEYNYTNLGMYYTLKYFIEINEGSVLEGSGLGIIPYFYDKAKRHYGRVYDLEDVANEFKQEEQTVKINTKMTVKKQDIKQPLPLLEWEGTDEDN